MRGHRVPTPPRPSDTGVRNAQRRGSRRILERSVQLQPCPSRPKAEGSRRPGTEIRLPSVRAAWVPGHCTYVYMCVHTRECACAHVCTHVCIVWVGIVHVCTCTHVSMHVCAHMCMHACGLHRCTPVCVSVFMCTCVCASVHVCEGALHMCEYACVCTCVRVYLHLVGLCGLTSPLAVELCGGGRSCVYS